MKRSYLYAITLIVLTLFLWAGYYLYLEYRPIEYKNGTFVEVPKVMNENQKERSA